MRQSESGRLAVRQLSFQKLGILPLCPFLTRLSTHASVRAALSRSLNCKRPIVSSQKLSWLSSLKFSKYSARKKLINSSAGKPVSFEHHESVEAFSGVNLTVVFTVLGVVAAIVGFRSQESVFQQSA